MSRPEQEPQSPRWHLKLLVALVVVVAGAIVARHSFGDRRGGAAGTGDQLVAGQPAEEERPGAFEKILPFVTEAGSAMLLGFMLALATRFALKAVIVALALGFVALQFLAYKGILTVDWGEFAGWTRDNVLNATSGADVGRVAQEKVPTVGAGLLGYLLGLKKG